jgi:[CysO sulfur-carrier protein]-thiocarboxylate-dependent cysteine synthase
LTAVRGGDIERMEPRIPASVPEGELSWRVTAADGWTVLVLDGELDFAHLDTARKALLDLGLTHVTRLALDLRGITFMDTSGVRLVLQAMHRADSSGAEFALIRGPQLVHQVLELVGLTDQIRIVDHPEGLGVRGELASFPTTPPRPARLPRGGREDLVDAIGHTPLVQLKRLSPSPAVRLWAKLESHNPTGSVKDRVARALVEDAEARGELWPGRVLLEPTSGNTGISLAMICARRGYRLKVVLPEDATPERTRLLRLYGAEIEYSPGELGLPGAVAAARALADADPSYYMPDQYGNPAIPLAHYHGTAAEILDDVGDVTAFVAALGTGATLTGVGRRLREELGPHVLLAAAEPMPDERSLPPAVDTSLLDRKLFVGDRDAFAWTRRLLEEEGVFAGVSSGASASIAVRVARELDAGDVVFMVGDDGWRHLSCGVHSRDAGDVGATAWW